MNVMGHFTIIAEILTMFIGIYCIYGGRPTLDRKTLGTFFGILFVLEIINCNQLNGLYTFLTYIIIFAYCKARFRCSIVEAIISLVLCIALITFAQIPSFFIVINILPTADEYTQYAVINIITLAIFVVLFYTKGLHRLKKSMRRHNKFVIVSLFFMSAITMIILFEMKLFHVVYIQYFFLAIPAIVLLLYAIVKLDTAQSETESMKERLDEMEGNKANYENLLTKVRLRQHAFKNHMETIASFHYTHKTEEDLMQMEETYCRQLLEENKYNELLLIGNNILAGYLCGKFQAAENEGIKIDYKIASKISQCGVSMYHVIEMLGILFDNAMEAVKDMTEKNFFFSVCEVDDEYEFLIRNPFPYVSYKEIEAWFRFEKSAKGDERGLGLYHLKCLCKEWNCTISCRNMEIDNKNWIVFSLRIEKTDSV